MKIGSRIVFSSHTKVLFCSLASFACQDLLQDHTPLILGRRVAKKVEEKHIAKLQPCR